MLSPSKPLSIRGLILLLVAGVLAATVAVAATAQSDAETVAEAQKQLDKHNYRQVLKLVDDLAKDASSGQHRQAQKLKLLAMSHLGNQDGYSYGKKIMAEHAAFKTDPQMWEAMGDDRKISRGGDESYKCYTEAARLYEKNAKVNQAADVHFKTIVILARGFHCIPKPASITQAQWDSSKRIELHCKKIVELSKHVAQMKVDSARKAKALYRGGVAVAGAGDWELAKLGIELFDSCVNMAPKTPEAPEALFAKAEVYERFRRYIEALEVYRGLLDRYPKSFRVKETTKRIAEIKAPEINLGVIKPFLPGQSPKVYWHSRNVKTLHLTAVKIDLVETMGKVEDAYRSFLLKELLKTVKHRKPVAMWTIKTPDAGKHQYYSHLPNEDKQTTAAIVPPLTEAGAYWVSAEGSNPDGEKATGGCLVLISRISAVAQFDHRRIVVMVADAEKGTPVTGAQVAVARCGGMFFDRDEVDHLHGKTNDAGLAIVEGDCLSEILLFGVVRKGMDLAIFGLNDFHSYRQEPKIKAYGFTERPVYRPGQTVHFKQIFRKMDKGEYHNLPGQKVRVEIHNPKGETIYAKALVTDKYGAVEGQLALGKDVPLGMYAVQVSTGGHRLWNEGFQFRVEEYKKPEFKVEVSAARTDYRVGDEMKIKVSARYYYGQPVVGGEVRFNVRKQSYTHSYSWPRKYGWLFESIHGRRYRYWPRFDEHVTSGTLKTDENGEAFITVKASPIKKHEKLDLKFVVSAEVQDVSRRVIRGQGEVKVTHAPFFIYPKAAQDVYGPGDKVKIEIRTENPDSKPVAGDFVVEAWQVHRTEKTETIDGREVTKCQETLAQKIYTQKISVPETGRAEMRFTPDQTGLLRVIVRQVNPPANQPAVEGKCDVWVASKTGLQEHYTFDDLQIIPASDQVEIGQTLRLLVNTRESGSYVLLTGQADELLFHQVVHVEKNSKLVEIPIDKKLCPNFQISASLLRNNRLVQDSKMIIVPPTHRMLKVDVKLDKGSLGGGEDNKFQPREKSKVRIRVTDLHTGKPVVGQVTLMMVDASVYYIQPEFRQAIEKFFYGHTRSISISQADSIAGPNWVSPIEPLRLEGSFLDGCVVSFDRAVPAPTAAREAMVFSAKGGAPKVPELAETVIRKEFRDTVLWVGAVETDSEGQAVVPVTLPDQLTTFALHAISHDTDTRVGQTRADVITTKRIIARLESGRFFTEGDHSYVTVIAHNYYDQPHQAVVDLTADDALKIRKVKLEGKWQDYVSGQELKVNVPAGGEVRLDFQTTALRPAEVKMLARVRTTVESDAIELKKPIVPWGAAKLLAGGGVLRMIDAPGKAQTAAWEFVVPEEIKEGSQSLVISLNPSIAAVAMESLPYLAAYPYGCVEQTMSRFLPTVVMQKTLADAGVSLDEVRELIEQQAASDPKLAKRNEMIRKRMGRNPVYSSAEVRRMIAKGLKRLADMQHGDGGWGWWKHGSSDPYMTAYVLTGLSIARDSDVKLPKGMIERATKWLVKQAGQPKVRDESRSWWYRHTDNDNTRAFMLYALSQAKPQSLKDKKLVTQLKRLYGVRDELTDYGRALLAIALHVGGMKSQAEIVVENFSNTAIEDKQTGDVHWGRSHGWWYWYHGATETTSWVLQAMLTVRPDDQYIPRAVRWLVHNRRGAYWYNTKTTAMAVYALARYAKVTGELDCDQTYEVRVDDAVTATVRVRRDNLFAFDSRIEISPEHLPAGKHKVTVTRKGKGNLYWGAYLQYFDKSERITAAGNRIDVARKYYRLIPETFTNTRHVWKDGKYVKEQFPDTRFKREPLAFGAEIASGEMIEVELTLKPQDNLEYMIIEDPKPAGCEPYRLTSGGSYGGGMYANMELRDTKIVFFASWLPRGERKVAYRLVCEQPGTFRVLPSAAEAMYTPWVQAISDSGKVTITEKPAVK